MYPRCRHDVQAAFKASVQKDVTRKERQKEQLGSILPPAGNPIEREQGLEPLGGENVSHHFLMLVTRIKRVPTARTVCLLSWSIEHIAAPCDLPEAPPPCY